jgi:metallophosphoesterase superfamily enzyme
VRLPCFVHEEGQGQAQGQGQGQAVLPAFGEFTGGWTMESAPGRRFYAVGGSAVWALPAAE